MTQSRLHILFSGSAAGTLRQVLRGHGVDDEVIHLDDNLSWGPIDSLDPEDRLSALVAIGLMNRAHWAWLPPDARAFWSRCTSFEGRRTVWTGPRSPCHAAGFLAYLDRFGDRPCDIVDVGQLQDRLRKPDGRCYEPILTPGELPPHQIARLAALARPLAPAEAARARRRWQRLVRENATLRVSGDDGLVSAPDDFYDGWLLRRCPGEWTRAARIVGPVMVDIYDHRAEAVGDAYQSWRLMKLVEAGRLQADPDIRGWTADRLCREASIRMA